MGASVGLALGSEDDEEYLDDEVNNEEYIDEMRREEYRRRVREICSNSPNKGLIEVFDGDEDEEIEEIDEDIEIIEKREMTFVNQDGEPVDMVNTSEGFVEIVEPYIISEDEYMDPSVFKEFTSNTLIYYEDDDTLATDRDEVVTDIEDLIGSSALTNFGYKSNNKDVVFVRNVKLNANFEVIREKGSYQSLVLGLPEEDVDYEKAKKFFADMDEGKV